MPSLARSYIREASRQTLFYPAWLPLQKMSLGDYGLIASDGTFIKKGNLTSDFGIEVKATPEPAPLGTLKLTSTSGVGFELKLAGTVSTSMPQLPQGSAGFKVGFNRSNSLFFELYDAQQDDIANLREVETEVTKLYIAGAWTKRWVIVRTVVSGRGTIAFSGDTDSQLVVSGNATFKDIADVDGSLTVVAKKSVAFEVVATPLTPLFLASRLEPVGTVARSLGLEAESFTPNTVRKHKDYMALVDVQAPRDDEG